jgi:hypothetical protein
MIRTASSEGSCGTDKVVVDFVAGFLRSFSETLFLTRHHAIKAYHTKINRGKLQAEKKHGNYRISEW